MMIASTTYNEGINKYEVKSYSILPFNPFNPLTDTVIFPIYYRLYPFVYNGTLTYKTQVPCYGINTIPSRILNAANYGVTGDSTDQTIHIQNALDTLSKLGGGTLYIPKGIYILSPGSNSYCISVPANVIIEGDSTGITLFRRVSNDVNFSNLFEIENGGNVVFKNFTTDGNSANQNASYEHQHNFYIQNSSCIRFYGISCENTIGDGIIFYSNSKNAIVENCSFSNIKRVGVNVSYLNWGNIYNCSFFNVENGVKIEKDFPDPNHPSRDIMVSDCNFNGSYLDSSHMYSGITIDGWQGDMVHNFTIKNNTFSNLAWGVYGLIYVDSIFISNNTGDSIISMCHGNQYVDSLAFTSGYMLVNNNTTTNGMGNIDTSTAPYVVFFFQNAIFMNNSFTENPESPYSMIGILTGNKNVQFQNDSIIVSGLSYGFLLSKCINLTFSNNYIKSNTSKNIFSLYPDTTIKFNNIYVEGNTFTGKFGYAVGAGQAIIPANGENVLHYYNNILGGTYVGDTTGIPSFFLSYEN